MKSPSQRLITPVLIVLSILLCGQGGPCTPQTPSNNNNGGSVQNAPSTMGGTMNVSSLTIPSGSTSNVTSDLTINATGNVTINGDLIADTTANGAAYSITIDAQGDIDISGTIQAGDGPGTSSGNFAFPNFQPIDLPADNANGENGAFIQIIARGNIDVRSSARLISGNGTDGIGGSLGGAGGNGGNIVICAGNKLTMRGAIQMGNGGNGGEAITDSQGELLSRFPNNGGDSGFLFVEAQSYDWPGLNTNEFSLDTIAYATSSGNLASGGFGGHAGLVTILDDPFECVIGTTAGPSENIVQIVGASYGGNGWWTGGNGGTISFISCLHGGPQGRDGISWIVNAGDGGSVTEREDTTIKCVAFPVVINGAVAGYGGAASGTAAPGLLGDSSNPDGGNGGNITVTGGNGGDGEFFADQMGGNGGKAVASAGFGGGGLPRGCDDFGPGGNGANGGDGTGEGGSGGNGVIPGTGGVGTAIGAESGDVASGGGDGGDGSVPGDPGQGGELNSTKGADGASSPNSIIGSITRTDQAPDGDPGELITPADCQF